MLVHTTINSSARLYPFVSLKNLCGESGNDFSGYCMSDLILSFPSAPGTRDRNCYNLLNFVTCSISSANCSSIQQYQWQVTPPLQLDNVRTLSTRKECCTTRVHLQITPKTVRPTRAVWVNAGLDPGFTLPTCVCALPTLAVVTEDIAEVVIGMSEIVIRIVCVAVGKKTDFVGDGVLSSSPSYQRLVVVIVTKTVCWALLVLLLPVIVMKRVGELARVVATPAEKVILPGDWLLVSEAPYVCPLDIISALSKESYVERSRSAAGLCIRWRARDILLKQLDRRCENNLPPSSDTRN
jgi:hypothetical protein